MRPILLIAGYIAAIFVGGSLLAPWIYLLIQWSAGHWQGLEKLASTPFHRIVSRSILLVALLGLAPFLKAIGIHSWREAGLPKPWPHRKHFGIGFLAGWISLAIVAGLALVSGARTWNGDHKLAQYLGHLASAAASAIVVGILEESLFRGAFYGSLRKSMRWPAALLLSSGVFAMLHFFQWPGTPSQSDWLSGLCLLPQMFRGFADWDAVVPGFFSLTLVGAILAFAYQRTGNLYFSIGLHAGWIFWLKTYGFLTRAADGHSISFWGTNKLTDGWMTVMVLGVLGLLGYFWVKPNRKGEP
jgi:membrane protease YdiL (CAAX protease family)